MARSPVDIASAMRDAAYVSVGLGVIAFQRLQVRRQELTRAFNGPVKDVQSTGEAVSALVGERVKLLEERVTAAVKR